MKTIKPLFFILVVLLAPNAFAMEEGIQKEPEQVALQDLPAEIQCLITRNLDSVRNHPIKDDVKKHLLPEHERQPEKYLCLSLDENDSCIGYVDNKGPIWLGDETKFKEVKQLLHDYLNARGENKLRMYRYEREATLNPDASKVITSNSYNDSSTIWDSTSSRMICTIESLSHPCFTWLDDRRIAILGIRDRSNLNQFTLIIYDAHSGKKLYKDQAIVLPHSSGMQHHPPFYNPHNSQIITCVNVIGKKEERWKPVFAAWNTENLEKLYEIEEEYFGSYCPNGNHTITVGSGTISIRNAQDGTRAHAITYADKDENGKPLDRLHSATYSKDGSSIVLQLVNDRGGPIKQYVCKLSDLIKAAQEQKEVSLQKLDQLQHIDKFFESGVTIEQMTLLDQLKQAIDKGKKLFIHEKQIPIFEDLPEHIKDALRSFIRTNQENTPSGPKCYCCAAQGTPGSGTKIEA